MDSHTLDFSHSPGLYYQALESFGYVPFPSMRIRIALYSSNIPSMFYDINMKIAFFLSCTHGF